MIDRLKGLESFEFRPHPHFRMPGNRLAVIQYFIRKCISDLAEKREKSSVYAEISTMRETITNIAEKNVGDEAKVVPETLTDDSLKAALQLSPTATRKSLALRFGISPSTIARHLKRLQAVGGLRRVGSRKAGTWVVLPSGK